MLPSFLYCDPQGKRLCFPLPGPPCSYTSWVANNWYSQVLKKKILHPQNFFKGLATNFSPLFVIPELSPKPPARLPHSHCYKIVTIKVFLKGHLLFGRWYNIMVHVWSLTLTWYLTVWNFASMKWLWKSSVGEVQLLLQEWKEGNRREISGVEMMRLKPNKCVIMYHEIVTVFLK